jgi:hypothetical protein
MVSSVAPPFTWMGAEGEQQLKDKEEDFQDIMAEESSRGKRRQKKAVTLARERMIRRVADLLADRNCEKRTFLAVIREYGVEDGSAEFLQLCELWDARHG